MCAKMYQQKRSVKEKKQKRLTHSRNGVDKK